MSNNNKHSTSRRRAANSVISLTQFAHSKSKGTRRAIEKCKQKKQSKFNRNAGLLREYRKAMKLEGYDAGNGGSRKRSLDNRNNGKNNNGQNDLDNQFDDDTNNNSENNNEETEISTTPSTKKRKRFHKSDPFAKAKAKAKQSKVEIEQRKEIRIQEVKENEKKMKQKKMKSRKLAKRTNRGQPIIKNVVGDLLEKIRKAG